LLDVAVRRARRIGRGGDLAKYGSLAIPEARSPLAVVAGDIDFRKYVITEHATRALIPVLADVLRVLDRLFRKLKSSPRRILKAEGKDYEAYDIKLGLLPLNLQIALKKAVEAATTAALYIEKYKGVETYIGHLLATCIPRATEAKVYVEVETWRERTIYYIYYPCKSHEDYNFELGVEFEVDKDGIGRFVSIGAWWD
jgi:hypothetical protein